MDIGSISLSKPRGELLISVKIKEGAFSGPVSGDTGYDVYIENIPGVAGPMLTVYGVNNGKIYEMVGGGSESASVVQEIAELNFTSFDFSTEVADTVARLDKQAQARGGRYFPPMAFDGAEYEIIIHASDGVFTLKEWNPSYTIDVLAPHSAKIAKLKAMLDILARFYGRAKFGV